MTNILYYEPSSGFGGSSSNLYHILRNLDKNKFHPVVVTHNSGDQFDRMKKAGVQVIKIPYPELHEASTAGYLKLILLFFTAMLPMAMKLRSVIKKEHISLVHINTNIMLGIPMIIASKLTRKTLFCYIRESRRLINRERLFTGLIDRFFILNKRALEMYKRDIPERKLTVIYDGVDLEEFRDIDPAPVKDEFHLNSAKVAGLVGRIISGKGQVEFVRAAKIVANELPFAKFMIVGDAKGEDVSYLLEVERLIKQEGLEDKIFLTGWRTDIKEIIASLDVLILASTTFPEGLPNCIIEGMALRKPVIVTDIPGPSEMVEHEKTGFVVAPGNIKDMAEKLIFLLNNEDAARIMGEKGRQRAERLFDVRKMVRQAERLYEEALAKKS